MPGTVYEQFESYVKELRTLGSVQGILGWDQETYMPPKGSRIRAAQMELLSALTHERLVSNQLGEMIEQLQSGTGGAPLTEEQSANVREMRRVFDRERKMPEDLVREMARTCSLAHEAWVKARRENAFGEYAPWLEKIVVLKRRESDAIGHAGGHVYDPLLDAYEPGAKTVEVGRILADLRDQLVPLVRAIAGSAKQPRQEHFPSQAKFPVEPQREFGLSVARDMGFDLEAGRLDTANHPFCSSSGPHDVRLTTRYDESDPRSCFFSILHEAGHGLYEQGFDPANMGTPMAEAVSAGIHESQSRLWENQIARSRPFWEHYYPRLQATFPEALRGLSMEDWYRSINRVQPSMIRVEADEVTYNLHILLRFEIECDLLTGRLSVSDLPRTWNDKMEQMLGLRPATDAEGVLQDIHWSFGGFGYFPTYTLGNLYAAQFMEAVRRDLPDLDDRLRKGDLRALREWLRDKIHRNGMRWRANELVQRVTGSSLSASPFLSYLRGKFGPLYGI